MENHIIIKEDGSRLEWKTNKTNKHFCLLYHDNNKKYIFTPTRNLKCKLFMIGGGGAGGYYFGGGGGAGAAYINNNFTFEQGKTYTFSIGTGGTCDISNFDKLFNSGLSLNVYNNTTPNFNNLSFNYDDYSSIGIDETNIMQSFIVNNINITPTIFNTNTTYIWNGYIKSTKNVITIRLNSKINVFIWVNTYKFTLDNTVIKTTGVGNAQEFRNLELDPNKYYNVKIIAYNYDTSNHNFNVSFENCQFYNFNKNNEKYNVVPATDTIMTFKSISTNENNVISCKGGGTGGYGLYNNNTNLNGGCGGGSGINKIKGISINNNPIYNGFDGAIGDYCGGGGGIISEANNNNGGEGKILNWFNETLLFGAGGNGANNNNNNKDSRNLGYGCGGNGGDCCYFSKSLINNNGNNGCIIIYVNDESDTIENFSTSQKYKNHDYLLKYNDTIASKLINESFQIADLTRDIATTSSAESRKTYFDNSLSFGSLAVNKATVDGQETDNNNMNNFIYDVLVISKIYAIAYRLLYHHYTITCRSDITQFANSMSVPNITFSNSNENTSNSKIFYNNATPNTCSINFNNLFKLDNIRIGSTSSEKTHYTNQDGMYIKNSTGDSSNGCPNMTDDVFTASITDITGNYGYHVPVYHNQSDGIVFNGLKLFYDNTYDKINSSAFNKDINKIGDTYTQTSTNINTYTIQNTLNTNVKFEFYNGNTKLDNTVLASLEQSVISLISTAASNKNNYQHTRILLYMEAFNNILNLNPYSTLLPTLKYNMFKYNAIIFNVAIQYQLFYYQNNRIVINSTPAYAKPVDNTTTPSLNTVKAYATNCKTDIDNFTETLKNIIKLNINTPDLSEKTLNSIVTLQQQKKSTDNIYITNQTELNKTINTYNSEFENYNKILYYYKIIIIIALFLVLIIFFIFTLNNIDNNTKIIIYVCIIFIIICILAYYNKFSISENFAIANNKASTESSIILTDAGDSYVINYNNYKIQLRDYLNKINKFITNGSINDDILQPLKVFNNTVDTVRRNKAEYYKLKKINLDNAIDLLKKSANSYYYLSIFIILSTIILLFTLILLLLNPNMLLQIISVAAIFMIILVYYVSYLLNKPTRLAETKNYWAYFNPSKDTIKTL